MKKAKLMHWRNHWRNPGLDGGRAGFWSLPGTRCGTVMTISFHKCKWSVSFKFSIAFHLAFNIPLTSNDSNILKWILLWMNEWMNTFSSKSAPTAFRYRKKLSFRRNLCYLVASFHLLSKVLLLQRDFTESGL